MYNLKEILKGSVVDNHCPPLSFHLRSGPCSFSFWGQMCMGWGRGHSVDSHSHCKGEAHQRTGWPSETDIRDGQRGRCGIQFWFLLPLKPSSTSLSTCPFHDHVTINWYLWWFAFFFCHELSIVGVVYWCIHPTQVLAHTLLAHLKYRYLTCISNYVEVGHIDEASLPLS